MEGEHVDDENNTICTKMNFEWNWKFNIYATEFGK